jgi:DNA helicase-2/ATP-dependent DNA helicase PcrA
MTESSVKVLLDEIEGAATRELVASNAPFIRVVAGPGAGKTYALKLRVKRRVREGMDPKRIFVGTFTRAVARALTKDFSAEENEEPPVVGTLHQLALKILKDHPAALKGRTPKFLLRHETECMLADIGPEVGGDLNDRKKWMKQLEADWSRGDPLGEAAFEGAVDHWLRSHRGMVIGEVVPIVSHGIETGDIPGGLFDEVIVDEFQDLTKAEQDLIQRIWAGPDTGSLVVLGDDDQSIYAFRHAHPEGIRGWHERFGTAEFHDIAIPENRRSLPDIVDLANSMMQTLGATKDPMVPVRAGDAHVAKIYWDTLNEEIEGIARAIVAISQSGRAIHVLVTRRFVGHELRRLLEDQGVAAMTSFHEELLQTVAVRRAFTRLSVIADPTNRFALRAWLSFHPAQDRIPSDRNCAPYRALVADRPVDIELLRKLVSGDISVSGTGSILLKRQAEIVLARLDDLEGRDAEFLVNAILGPEALALCDEQTAAEAGRDLEELRAGTLEILAGFDGDLKETMEEVRYRIANRIPLIDPEDEPAVEIMTLYGAKGLEADIIFLAGMADEMFERDAEGNYDPEDGRLVYVAVTRARDILVISRPRRMYYSVARRNYVREVPGQVRNVEGTKVLNLTHPAFVPAAGTRPGTEWLEEWLAAPPA